MERLILLSALDSSHANIAIVDHTGTIVYVNELWRQYAAKNDAQADFTAIGLNYLEVCKQSVAACPYVIDIIDGIESVMRGDTTAYQRIYPCHSPYQHAWYNLRVVPLQAGTQQMYMISHEDKSVEVLLRKALEREGNADRITGLPNRIAFHQALEQQWRRDLRTKSEMSLLLISMDEFDAYAAQFGQSMVEQCTDQVARTLNAFARRPNDFLARIANDDYALILGATTQDDALTIAEQLRNRVERLAIPNSNEALSAMVTISIGLASMTPHRHLNTARLLAKAEAALRRCQNSGGNTIST